MIVGPCDDNEFNRKLKSPFVLNSLSSMHQKLLTAPSTGSVMDNGTLTREGARD